MNVNEVEAVWLSVTLAGFVLTLFALWDAWVARGVVKRLNGHAREIAAAANVRREAIRLVVQTLFLIVVIPGLFSDRPLVLSISVAALIAVPVVLLANSVVDTVDRRRLIGVIETAMRLDSERSLGRIEAAIAENTELTQLAADHADAAYKVANNVNQKIASQGEAIIEQGEHAAADRLIGADTNETAHRIDERIP